MTHPNRRAAGASVPSCPDCAVAPFPTHTRDIAAPTPVFPHQPCCPVARDNAVLFVADRRGVLRQPGAALHRYGLHPCEAAELAALGEPDTAPAQRHRWTVIVRPWSRHGLLRVYLLDGLPVRAGIATGLDELVAVR